MQVSWFPASSGLRQARGCGFPGPLQRPSATSAPPSAPPSRRQMRSPAGLSRGMGQKVAGTGGKPTGAREPAPQRPPGETPEPPEERTKEATAGKDHRTGREHRTGPGETGFPGLPEVALPRVPGNPGDRATSLLWGTRSGRQSCAVPVTQTRSGHGCAPTPGAGSPDPLPALAAPDCSAWILRLLFQNMQ